MATKKRLPLIYEIENFTDTYLVKLTKFQGNGFAPFWSSEPFTGLEVETPSPAPGALGLSNHAPGIL